jgi:hypothetical protein
MPPEPTLRARDIAAFVGGIRRANRLMASGAIRSWVVSTTTDKRIYRVTVASEVARWQARQLRRPASEVVAEATPTPDVCTSATVRMMTINEAFA